MASKQITSKGTWRISSTSSTKFLYRRMRSFRRSWTHSGEQPRGRRFRGDTAKRLKTAFNNAQISNYASASTWDSSASTAHTVR